jgi:hypothetical protein
MIPAREQNVPTNVNNTSSSSAKTYVEQISTDITGTFFDHNEEFFFLFFYFFFIFFYFFLYIMHIFW